MSTDEIVKFIEALPEEKQQEVRNFAEFIARKNRLQQKSSRRAVVSTQRSDAVFWASPPSIEVLAAQQGVRPIKDTETLRGKNIWPEEDDIDEFLETIQRWRSNDDNSFF